MPQGHRDRRCRGRGGLRGAGAGADARARDAEDGLTEAEGVPEGDVLTRNTKSSAGRVIRPARPIVSWYDISSASDPSNPLDSAYPVVILLTGPASQLPTTCETLLRVM